MIFNSLLTNTTTALVAILVVTALGYYHWAFQYWKRRNVPQLKPEFLFGNTKNAFKRTECLGVTFKRLYDEIKQKKWKHGGVYFFTTPVYLPVDLNYIHNILIKDFEYFADRQIYHNEKNDPISAHLLAICGEKWRTLRAKLAPTFTPGKLKNMFPILKQCVDNLQSKMLEEFKKQGPIDIKELLACFTTDIIGSCAFGLECKTIKEDNSPFRKNAERIFNPTTAEVVQTTFTDAFPNVSKLLKLRRVPKDASNFFFHVVKDTIAYREKNQYKRADFMQSLINLKNSTGDKSLTIEEVVAQSFIFFMAGYETSSTTMTFALYELARHQHVQDKVRQEIRGVLGQNHLTYEDLNRMKYTNQVIDETLRMYPPAPNLTRTCLKNYKIQDQEMVIEKGTTVLLSVLGIHYDPDIYPEPDKFDPERFSKENKASRHHCAHIPFGEGPRICIGKCFGLVQAKLGLVSLLKSYKFTINPKTREPIEIHPTSYILTSKDGIWLDAQKI